MQTIAALKEQLRKDLNASKTNIEDKAFFELTLYLLTLLEIPGLVINEEDALAMLILAKDTYFYKGIVLSEEGFEEEAMQNESNVLTLENYITIFKEI